MSSHLRAGLYQRVSLDRTGEGAAVERQAEDCAALVAARGWVQVATFTDNSVSAAGGRNRPGFDELLAAVDRGDLDVIVAWAWDRLSRNRRDEVRLIEACRAHSVSVALVRGTGDLDMSSAIGRAVAEIMATIGRMENDQKTERQKRAFAQRAAKGLPHGSIVAFGYAPDRVSIVEHEAELIRNAYTDVLAGASCRSIATEWNRKGILTRTWPAKEGQPARLGGPWSGAAIRQMLVRPRYAGIRATSSGGRNRRDLREVGPAVWPGIVTEEVWRAVHAILTAPGRTTRPVGRDDVVHMLVGIAECGRCGSTMRSHQDARGATSYTCKASPHLKRTAGPLDDLITRLVVGRLSAPDAADLLTEPDRGPDVARLREQAMALRERRDHLAAEYARGRITASQLAAGTDAIGADLGAAEREMANTEHTRARVLREIVTADGVAAAWGRLDMSRRRAVIRSLLVPVVLPAIGRGRGFNPDSVSIRWL